MKFVFMFVVVVVLVGLVLFVMFVLVVVDVVCVLFIVNQNVCMGCYVVDCKFVGFVYQDVVVKYKGDVGV